MIGFVTVLNDILVPHLKVDPIVKTKIRAR